MKDKAKTREQLIHELQHLRQRISGLEASDAQLREAREELTMEAHQLAERTKELNCLYGITELLAKSDISLPEIFQGIVELLPPAFQYPEITASRLTLDNETFTAGNFRETAWKHTENIMVQGQRVGSLEVCYLKKKPNQDEGPFLTYEIGMLKAISIVLGRVIERIRAQETLRDAEAQKQGILDASVDRIRLTDTDMRIIWANKTTAKVANIAPEELIGKFCFEALVGRSSPCSGCPSKKALRSGHMERALVHRSGSKSPRGEAYGDNYAVPIKNESGDIVHLVQITRNVTRQKLAEKALKEREKELKLKAASLADLNTALRVLLDQKDNDKADIEEKVMLNMRELVIPFIEKLKKTSLTSKQAAYVQVLESNLNDVISPFSRTLSAKFLSLTPTEIQIAGMVREGKMSQEIADVLNLSKRTVESHRAGIRKKLGLKNKKANLRSHLLSI
jgi:DNA-binding CsgD family transcriptional regulator/PAS domain-containing protein